MSLLLDPTRYSENIRYRFHVRPIYNLGHYNLYRVTPFISKSKQSTCENHHILDFLNKFYCQFRKQLKPKQKFVIKVPKSYPNDFSTLVKMERYFGRKMHDLYPDLFANVLQNAGSVLVSPLYKFTLNSVRNNVPSSFWTKVVKQLSQAVFHCHEAGVVHGDVKPDNIFITENFNVLLGDWDISQKLDEEEFDFTICTPDHAFNMNPLFRPVNKIFTDKHDCFNKHTHNTCRVINDYYGLVTVMTTIVAHLHQKNTGNLGSVDRFASYQMLIDPTCDKWTWLFRPYTEANPQLVFDMCKDRILYYSNSDMISHIMEQLLKYKPPDTEDEFFFVEIVWKCKCAIIQAFLENRSPMSYQVFIPTLCRYYAKSSNKAETRQKITTILAMVNRKLKWPKYHFTSVCSNSWWHWKKRKKKYLMIYLPKNHLDATLQQHVWQYVNGWTFELLEWSGGTIRDAKNMARSWSRTHGYEVDFEVHRCLR